jgi:hypothetical protein
MGVPARALAQITGGMPVLQIDSSINLSGFVRDTGWRLDSVFRGSYSGGRPAWTAYATKVEYFLPPKYLTERGDMIRWLFETSGAAVLSALSTASCAPQRLTILFPYSY